MDIKSIEGEALTEASNHAGTLAMIRGLDITSTEDFEFASELVKRAKANHKRLDERRTAITKPLLASKRQVDELFAPALTALKEIERALKEKIGTYTLQQTGAVVQAMQDTAAAYAAGGTPTEAIPELPTAKGITVRASWDFEIVNPAEVPRELCSPDPAKIQQAIWYADTPHTAPRAIPGIVFKLRANVTVRADKPHVG